MYILVIGNGFDLAHGLPTKYTDFLEFIKVIKQIINYTYINNIAWETIHPDIIEIIEDNMKNKSNNLFSQEKYWKKLIDNNFWIEYFSQSNTYQKENWIDFETEISNVIKSIDTDMKKEDFDKQIADLSNKYLKEKYLFNGYGSLFTNENGEKGGKQEITFRCLKDCLLDDLNKFIRAFEIYLSEYVQKIDISFFSSDIVKSFLMPYKKDDNYKGDKNKIINFNYTNTFKRHYLHKFGIYVNDDDMDYIHGKADINNTIESNNMVLGIDEYLSDDRKNKDVEFVAFKKFYQRIYKQTGCKYKEWIDEIKTDKNQKHYLYIFGHSLDITDKDILRGLILNDNVYTTIFYPDKKELGRKITNLVKVIGQDELIRRTGGSTKTIEFKLQEPMCIDVHDC